LNELESPSGWEERLSSQQREPPFMARRGSLPNEETPFSNGEERFL
jgi:hypothetical protein